MNISAMIPIGICFFCVTSMAQGTAEDRFYSHGKVVARYASEALTNPVAAKNAADGLLILSESFRDNWNYGNATHHAHLVLGRLHLLEGDVIEAVDQLKLAGQTNGSPQLDSFGPNMTLAKELLERGEKNAVLEYFDECAKFWEGQFAQPKLDQWKADIQSGKIPEFGANLVY